MSTRRHDGYRNTDTGGATPDGEGRAMDAAGAPGSGMDTPQSALSTGNTTGDVKSGETDADDAGALNITEEDLQLPERIVARDAGPERDDFESEPLTDRIEDEQEKSDREKGRKGAA